MFAAKNSIITGGISFTYLDASTTGASVTTSGNYKIATFSGSGAFTVNSIGTAPTEANTVSYLVVAGGGGGGNQSGGGGGGGGGFLDSSSAVTVQSYTVTVGGGGSAGLAALASDVWPFCHR